MKTKIVYFFVSLGSAVMFYLVSLISGCMLFASVWQLFNGNPIIGLLGIILGFILSIFELEFFKKVFP